MSESRVRENRTHGSMRRREATPDQSAMPRGPRTPLADPTEQSRAGGFRLGRPPAWSSPEAGLSLAVRTALLTLAT